MNKHLQHIHLKLSVKSLDILDWTDILQYPKTFEVSFADIDYVCMYIHYYSKFGVLKEAHQSCTSVQHTGIYEFLTTWIAWTFLQLSTGTSFRVSLRWMVFKSHHWGYLRVQCLVLISLQFTHTSLAPGTLVFTYHRCTDNIKFYFIFCTLLYGC